MWSVKLALMVILMSEFMIQLVWFVYDDQDMFNASFVMCLRLFDVSLQNGKFDAM